MTSTTTRSTEVLTPPPVSLRDFYLATTVEEVESLITRLGSTGEWIPVGGHGADSAGVASASLDPSRTLSEDVTNAMDAILDYLKAVAPEELKEQLAQCKTPREVSELLNQDWGNGSKWLIFRIHNKDGDQGTISVRDHGPGLEPEMISCTIADFGRTTNKSEDPTSIGGFDQGGKQCMGNCPYTLFITRHHTRNEVAVAVFRLRDRKNGYPTLDWLVQKGTELPLVFGDATIVDPASKETMEFTHGSEVRHIDYAVTNSTDLNKLTTNAQTSGGFFQKMFVYFPEPLMPIFVVDDEEYGYDTKNSDGRRRGVPGAIHRLSQKAADKPDYYYREEVISVPGLVGPVRVCVALMPYWAENHEGDRVNNEAAMYLPDRRYIGTYFVHGQLHALMPASMIRELANLPHLRPHLYVGVDLSGLSPWSRTQLFPSSRDGMKNKEEAKALQKAVAACLSSDEVLRTKNAEYGELFFGDPVNEEAILERVYAKLKEGSSSTGRGIPPVPGDSELVPLVPRRNPQVLEFSTGKEGRPRTPQVGKSFKIKIRTDAYPTYMAKNLTVEILDAKGRPYPGLPHKPRRNSTHTQGHHNIEFCLTDEAKVGDVGTVQIKMKVWAGGDIRDLELAPVQFAVQESTSRKKGSKPSKNKLPDLKLRLIPPGNEDQLEEYGLSKDGVATVVQSGESLLIVVSRCFPEYKQALAALGQDSRVNLEGEEGVKPLFEGKVTEEICVAAVDAWTRAKAQRVLLEKEGYDLQPIEQDIAARLDVLRRVPSRVYGEGVSALRKW